MKIYCIISILLFVMGLSVMGQTSTVYTPWGTEVSVTEPDEGGLNGRLYYENEAKSAHPNAIYHKTWPVYPYLDLSSTFRFNCHGYAWHMFWFGEDDELDEPVKMTLTEAEKYFNDGSFIECTQSEAEIWWINGGSHSAAALDNPAYLKSKWANGPLVTHLINDQPYIPDMNYTSFFKQCYKDYTGVYTSDITLNECSAQFTNSGTSNYVDLEIEYEVAIRFEGVFSTGTGSTLYFHPD